MASERVEIITRGDGRRRFSAEEKVRLVAETFRPGETVTAVSRRHGICTSLLHRWRRAARGEVPSRRKARPRLLPVCVVAPDAPPLQPKPATGPGIVPDALDFAARPDDPAILRALLIEVLAERDNALAARDALEAQNDRLRRMRRTC